MRKKTRVTADRLQEPCFQCDLDIGHVCYAGDPQARWGMGDEAIAALEGAQRHGFVLTAEQLRAWHAAAKKKPRRRTPR